MEEEKRDWLEEGNEWYEKGDYLKAIECYDSVIKINQDLTSAYNSKGNALFMLGDYEGAMECYEKAAEKDNKEAFSYVFNGLMLQITGQPEKAIKRYDMAIKKYEKWYKGYGGNRYAFAYNKKGESLYALGEEEKAVKCWDKAAELDVNSAGEKFLLYDSLFFKETVEGTPKTLENQYRTIYILSLKILKLLQITESYVFEKNVAHYTKTKTAHALFFYNKEDGGLPMPFRLYSVTNSNDTQEGKPLFQYLFGDEKMQPQAERSVAFVGCFMFNYDSLNQFRLYGRDETKPEGEREGTGISIVMKSDFFCLTNSTPFQQASKQNSDRYGKDNKAPLFRCIYIDPEANHVASVGHRDYHTFYKTKEILYNHPNREKSLRKIPAEIRKYKKIVEGKTIAVTKLLEGLRDKIKAHSAILDNGVVCNLLLNLRYIVKHVAFKEEQECRIVKIKTNSGLDKEDPRDENHERFYIDYLPVTGNVSRVYFGLKTSGLELFKSLLVYRKGFENVVWYRSTSPLA